MSCPHCCHCVAIDHRSLGSTECAVQRWARPPLPWWLAYSPSSRLPACTFHTHCALNPRVTGQRGSCGNQHTGRAPGSAHRGMKQAQRSERGHAALSVLACGRALLADHQLRGHGGNGMITSQQRDHVPAVPRLGFPKTTPFCVPFDHSEGLA